MRLLFGRRTAKWHEVRWFSDDRDIYLAMQFADRPDDSADRAVRVERLQSKDPAAEAAQPPLDESALVSVIESAVEEYNRHNLCTLSLSGVRYRAKGGADVADHKSAAIKLLNLL